MTHVDADNLELLNEFAEEAISALTALPAELATYRQNPGHADPINAVFRAVHSIKGNAGFFGLTTIKSFAHALENGLDNIRKQQLSVSADLERTLIHAFDELEAMIGECTEADPTAELTDAQQDLLARIAAGTTPRSRTIDDPPPPELLELAEAMRSSGLPEAQDWATRLDSWLECNFRVIPKQSASKQSPLGVDRPQDLLGKQLLHAGEDLTDQLTPLLTLFVEAAQGRYQEQLALNFIAAARQAAQLPSLASIGPALYSAANDLELLVTSKIDVDATLLSVIWEHIAAPLSGMTQKAATNETLPAQPNETSPAQPKETAEAKPAAAPPAGEAKSDSDSKARHVRVKEERLDEFLDQVSKLFITGELLKDLHGRFSETDALAGLVEEMRQINQTFAAQSRQLQQNVASLRQVTLSTMFSKFGRMARSLAQQLGKQVDVSITGEEIEVDKSLIEPLDAALTHLIRNMVDHGVEPPDERGTKSPVGLVRIVAEQSRTHLRISIADDGRGIDPHKLRDAAVAKGVLTPERAAALSDGEAVELIFHPGFSTAKQLSDVSGRGVGLDVVRTNVRDRDGDVFVESTVGRGTTFVLEIPLRQAVIVVNALMLAQGPEQYVVPFEYVREIVRLRHDQLSRLGTSVLATVRGEIHEVLSLAQVVGRTDDFESWEGEAEAVLVGTKHGSLLLLPDRVCGHRQVVVSSLVEVLSETGNVSGVAQLGGGRLALVLGVPELVQRLATSNRAPAEV